MYNLWLLRFRQVNICVNLDVQVQKMEEVICVNELYVKKATGIVLEEEEARSSGPLASGSTKVDWKAFSMWSSFIMSAR